MFRWNLSANSAHASRSRGLLVVIGALFYFGGNSPPTGSPPGDIVHRGEHTTFYFPIVTCLLLSVAVTLLFWLVGQFRK